MCIVALPKVEINSEHYQIIDKPLLVDGTAVDVIQPPKPKPRILHYNEPSVRSDFSPLGITS
jgi:hypothetical protein